MKNQGGAFVVPRAKAVGQRGSWFARIGVEEYACVHEHWFRRGSYHDPELRTGDPKSEALVAALRDKKIAILTADLVSKPDAGGPSSFRRKGYIALWSIDDVAFDTGGLRFRFIARLAEL